MLAKFAEDDRIEQMNAQKRRMKQLEHKRSVQSLIEDRREQFARERVGDAVMHKILNNQQQNNKFSTKNNIITMSSKHNPWKGDSYTL